MKKELQKDKVLSKKALVIGGSGFMGSHTADHLSDNGFDVLIADYHQSNWIKADQTMVMLDILDPVAVKEALKGVDYVYHFAGIADIGQAKSDPYNTLNVNINGTMNILQAAVESKVKRFIYASTMYVYNPYGSFYRASKQATEILIEAYNEHFNLDYTILRFGSLYGPRTQEWNGLYKYVKEILDNKKLIYKGTGKERREYIHVEDAARLSVKILDNHYVNKAVTVTGHQILDSHQLLEMIFEIAGVEQNIIYSDQDVSRDHYGMTPYRYSPKKAIKIIPDEYIDIGQGILEIVEEVISSKEKNKNI
jgi:UDP-glucose 4-epimerase